MNQSVCVKPEFIDGHICYKLRNSLGVYGGIRVVRVSDDLGGSSSRGQAGMVAKSAVVHSRQCVKNPSEFRWVLIAVACSSHQPSVGRSDTFEDFRCLNSYPLDQVGSGRIFRGKIYDWLKKGILLMWINFLHSCPEALHGDSCAKTHFIHCLSSSCQANIWSNATLLQPRVCFLNEIINREGSESCYITIILTGCWKNRNNDLVILKTKKNVATLNNILDRSLYDWILLINKKVDFLLNQKLQDLSFLAEYYLVKIDTL